MIGNPLLCVLRLSESKLSEFYCRAAMNAKRSSHDKAICPSVRLSVCLSVKRMICHKTKLIWAHILIPHERTMLVLWKQESLVGATPSRWNLGSSWPRWSENADFQSIFARSASPI